MKTKDLPQPETPRLSLRKIRGISLDTAMLKLWLCSLKENSKRDDPGHDLGGYDYYEPDRDQDHYEHQYRDHNRYDQMDEDNYDPTNIDPCDENHDLDSHNGFASFRWSVDVMDYSLLVGVDEQNHELVLGIIDFMRQYTWDKHLEAWVKASGGKSPVNELLDKSNCQIVDEDKRTRGNDPWSLVLAIFKLPSQVNDQATQLRLLQTENTRITNGEGTSGGTNDRNGVGGTDDGGKHAGGNGAFKVFDEMPILEKINQEGSVKEYYDVEADVVMFAKAGKGNELGSNESSEVEVNGVVIVDEPMKGEVKNKSEVIVDEFVHNDGNSEDIEAIWKWFKRKNADSTCFKRKNRGWNRIVGTQCKVILRKWKFERLKWPNRKKRREEPDGGTNVSLSVNGNSDCMELDVESVEECLSGMKFVKNSAIKNGNEVLDGVGDIKKEKGFEDVSNSNFVVCDTLFERKKTRPWWRDKQGRNKTCPWGFDKHRVGDREDEDMESIGVISNNFKGIWEDSEKMIILLIHMVSGVKRGLSDSKEKGLSNLKCFIQGKGVTRSISDFDGKYLFMSCKDANKDEVNICYWELSGCKWHGRKKTCDTLRDGNCEIIKLEETLIRVVSSCWFHQFVYLITLMNDMLCVSWLKGSFSGKDGYGFALFANKNVNSLYPLIMVEKPAEDSVLNYVWEETKVMDNVIKCFGKGIAVNKNQMVFKLLLEFASNIHRVHDINDTRLREIDAKFGDLGLEKRLKLVKKTYLGHDRRAHLLHFSLENLISGVQKLLVDSWVFGCIVWIRNIEVQFDVPKSEVQPEPKCGPEPEREAELMVINKELLNYPSSRPVLSIKLPELRNKLEDKQCLKKED
ncbi:putative reverse transcriptase domain-containing protein [Tanacetum coccineum]